MFNLGKKQRCLLAAATGTVVPLSDVPDEAFSGKMLGDGYAVKPDDGTIYSPADGVIEDVTDTLHAYSITTDDDLDVLVHVGIDTVELKGEGFISLVENGEQVEAGQPIAKVDLDLIRERGFETITPVVIANVEDVKSMTVETGEVSGGASPALVYKL